MDMIRLHITYIYCDAEAVSKNNHGKAKRRPMKINRRVSLEDNVIKNPIDNRTRVGARNVGTARGTSRVLVTIALRHL